MKNDLQTGLQNIIDAINNLIEPKLGSLRYDKTFRAKVISDEGNNVYGVQINGKNYKAVYTGEKIPVGQIVKVKAPLNNFSDIYIETLPGSGSGSAGNYNNLLNKPILNTNNTGTQVPSATETIQGTISLHKVSKTGNYNDLLNKPTLDFIPTSEKGATNGVAGLDENKKVSKSNLPTDTVYDNNYVHTDNNFTTAMKNKLDSVEEGAEPNKIEIIQRNGSVLPINNKIVNVEVPTKTSDLTNDNGFISSIPVASDTILGGIKVGENLSITADGVLSAKGGGTTDYSVLLNKPVLNTANTKSLAIDSNETINGIVSLHKISKTGSYEDLLNKPTIPTKTSDLENDSGFITNTVNDLTNYYLKSETYTQTEVNNLIGQIKTISIEVVDTLPTTGEDNKIYLVPKEGSTGDVYNEYIWVNDAWELIGSTQVDLTGYATQDWVNNQIKDFLNESQVTQIVNNSLTNYYTKTETYSKTEVNNLLNGKANTDDIPTKTGDLTNNGDGTTGSKYITNSDLNTELESKQDKITGGATTIVTNDLTVNRALVSNANGKVVVSNTTSTELGYLSGARSNLQSQIDTITTEGGQPNVIEIVQENGVPLEITNKTVNVTVPTNLENGIATGSLRAIGATSESNVYKLGDNSFAEGKNTKAPGSNSHAEGYNTTASGNYSHAEGQHSSATNTYSHAEGNNSQATGIASHAEGNSTIASGERSHAEGSNTKATSQSSHAEGVSTLAGRNAFIVMSGDSTAKTYTLNSVKGLSIDMKYSIKSESSPQYLNQGTITAIDTDTNTITVSYYRDIEGDNKYLYIYDRPDIGIFPLPDISSGFSHVEGQNTVATHYQSHAEGLGTIANGDNQHVQGKYNISDDTSLDIIGNGTGADARSNAYTLDRNGNAWYSGEVYVGSNSGTNKDAGSVKLAKTTDIVKSYNDLTDKPTIPTKTSDLTNDSGFLTEIPIASATVLGGIKVGENLNIADDGTLSAQAGTTIKNLVDSSGEGALRQINAAEASGTDSFAEGYNTTASGAYSHAEGFGSKAEAYASHVEGAGTIASGNYSHAQGSYNIPSPNYLDVVGNGKSDAEKSNAYTLDYEGNGWFAGEVYVGSNSGTNKDSGSVRLAKISELDTKVDKTTTIAGIDLQNNITVGELVDALKIEMLKIENPVGHIRMETKNINPATYLGFGTWVLWGSGKVPVGVNTSDSSFNAVEKTGGSKTVNISHSHTIASHNHGGNTGSHVLTINEIPAHNHAWKYASTAQAGSSTWGSAGEGSTGSAKDVIGNTGGGKGHTHTISASGQQKTNSAGSTSLSLLQPYITCYMWKRTA